MADMELEGMESILSKIEEMGEKGSRIQNKALKKAGGIILKEAKQTSAFKDKSGELRKGLNLSGIRNKGNRKYILVGIQKGDNSRIFYGKFLEFGTSKMPAKPFMAPAYESKKEEAKEIIKQEIKNALGL